jgi:hypothetical protein
MLARAESDEAAAVVALIAVTVPCAQAFHNPAVE